MTSLSSDPTLRYSTIALVSLVLRFNLFATAAFIGASSFSNLFSQLAGSVLFSALCQLFLLEFSEEALRELLLNSSIIISSDCSPASATASSRSRYILSSISCYLAMMLSMNVPSCTCPSNFSAREPTIPICLLSKL